MCSATSVAERCDASESYGRLDNCTKERRGCGRSVYKLVYPTDKLGAGGEAGAWGGGVGDGRGRREETQLGTEMGIKHKP